jgi:O-antigen/teichoic acid export membrane protein
MAIANAFIEGGFGTALIQKREPSSVDICSVFYFNILVSFIVMILFWLGSPWVAAFYRQPILVPLMRALSLTIVINSFGLIQTTIIIRQINFKTLTKVTIAAGAVSGIIGIILALRGFGVWSLVIQQISSALFRTVLLWVFNPWRPALIFSFRSLKQMFGFGSRMFASGLLNQVFDNLYPAVIGKLFSVSELGFYNRASSLQAIPTVSLSSMVGRVTFPVFSTIQDDPERMKRGLKKALTSLVLINFPLMVGMAVLARPLILVLFTSKWAGSIPFLQLLCFLGLMYPLHSLNLNILQALGKSDLFLRLEIIKKLLIIINIAVTWRWGINAMIYGMIAMSAISYFLNSYYTGVLIGYTIWAQLIDLFPYLLVALLMGSAVFSVGFLSFSHVWVELMVQIGLGAVVYCILCRLFRLPAFIDAWQIVKVKLYPR